jgi:pimeloyl-ACP methyl ester carboxylesterase
MVMRSPDESFVEAWDGTALFYERRGRRGSPAVVLLDGLLWDGNIWKYFAEYFQATHEIIHPHYRGHGRSGTPADLSRSRIEDVAEDVETILRHSGVESACFIGHSMGVQVALEYWRRYPDRIQALVLVNGTYGKTLDTFHDWNLVKYLFPVARHILNRSHVARAFWHTVPAELAFRIAALTGEVNARLIRKRDLVPYLRNIRYVDFTFFLNLVQALGQHNAWDYLPQIDVPTLVIAAERDTFTPPRQAQLMADQIPEAEFMLIRGGSHAVPVELPDLINLRVEKFLIEQLGDAGARSSWNAPPPPASSSAEDDGGSGQTDA